MNYPLVADTQFLNSIGSNVPATPTDRHEAKRLDEVLGDPRAAIASLPASTYQFDASRVLLGLMGLSKKAENDRLSEESSSTVDGVISKDLLRKLLAALQFRDLASVTHSRRTAILATGLAQHLGWENRMLRTLEVASLLHDIGKIGVPDHILFKPGRLNADEVELMALHYNIGIDILQACRVDPLVLKIVSQAQTRYSNIEGGLRDLGSEVHQGARILAVADAYESLSQDQVFRQAMGHDEIMGVLKDAAWSQFDGNIIAALERWINSEGLRLADLGARFGEALPSSGVLSPAIAAEATNLCNMFSYLFTMETVYDGFFLVDADLRIMVWNRSAELSLKRPAADVLGQRWTSRFLGYAEPGGQPLDEKSAPLARVVQSGRAVTSNLLLTNSAGGTVAVELQSIPLFDDAGRLQGFAEMFRDVKRDGTRRSQEVRDLKIAASRDALTGVANRGELERQLGRLAEHFGADDDCEPYSIIFVDVDHFKSVNDSHGHAAGDQVLIDIARLLQNETYSGELIGRYGGEEFVVICPGTNQEQAYRRSERLRTSLEQTRLGGKLGLQLSASFGVSTAIIGDLADNVVKRADSALYEAKSSGRNRTCVALPPQGAARVDRRAEGTDRRKNPFEIETEFHVLIAADMLIHKLSGYIHDKGAKIVDVSGDTVVLEVGKPGWFGGWGRDARRKPVQVQISYTHGNPHTKRGPAVGNKQHSLTVRVSPLGRIPDSGLFQARGRDVINDLRHYLAANETRTAE